MKLFLFRHAEKEMSQGFATRNNPSLSKNGHHQAQKIVEMIEALSAKDPAVKPEMILSSPKIRAVQTLTPLAEKFGIKVQLSEELFERHHEESGAEFINRVKGFLEWLETLNKTVYVVTHFDWLDAAMIAIPCDTNLNSAEYQHWSPAQSMEFEIKNELWNLIKQRELIL